MTIGSGAPFAEAVYKTLYYFQEKLGLTDQDVFQYLMQFTALSAPNGFVA
jgi:hypothetical protein